MLLLMAMIYIEITNNSGRGSSSGNTATQRRRRRQQHRAIIFTLQFLFMFFLQFTAHVRYVCALCAALGISSRWCWLGQWDECASQNCIRINSSSIWFLKETKLIDARASDTSYVDSVVYQPSLDILATSCFICALFTCHIHMTMYRTQILSIFLHPLSLSLYLSLTLTVTHPSRALALQRCLHRTRAYIRHREYLVVSRIQLLGLNHYEQRKRQENMGRIRSYYNMNRQSHTHTHDTWRKKKWLLHSMLRPRLMADALLLLYGLLLCWCK